MVVYQTLPGHVGRSETANGNGEEMIAVKFLATALLWWLMSGWAFSTDSQVIGGPFDSFAKCDAAGHHLPYQYYVSGWHCDSE